MRDKGSEVKPVSFASQASHASFRLPDRVAGEATRCEDYDALNRLTAKDLPGSEPDATYAYDLLGRMTSAVQNSITNSMTWDALGRKLTETAPQGTVTSEYDLAGRRTKVTLPGSTGLFANYDYDLLGNVTFIRENGASSGVGVLATYQYDSLSRRSSVTFGNGVVQGFTFDNASRLATQTNDLASTANDLTQTFAYNPASQISSVTRSNDLYAWTGHFDQNAGSTPNGLNQIGNVGAKTVTHDTKGNITAVGTDAYGYSSENFLTSGPNSSSLGYDPMGRLYQVASGSSTTRMGYDGLDRIAEYDGSNAILRRYIHGPGIDNPLVAYEGTGTTSRSFLSSDERGSIISLTDNSGALLNINRYDEYGVPQSTNLGKFGYTGQAWVPEIGLWYFKARYLRPDIGRFMQTDRVGYEDSMNLYAYVGNEPVNFVDASGLRRVTRGEVALLNPFSPVVDLSGTSMRQILLPGIRSYATPQTIYFSYTGYAPDFSSLPRADRGLFYHEFYHVFEYVLGNVVFERAAITQWATTIIDKVIGTNLNSPLYDYNPSLPFMKNSFEARANYFAGCMTGRSGCGALEGFSGRFGSHGYVKFKNGKFVVTYRATGSRIPITIIVAPDPDEDKKKGKKKG